MSKTTPVTEYEKEIRALYRERNERTFGGQAKKSGGLRRLIDFLALIALIGVVSAATSINLYSWLTPSSFSWLNGRASHTIVAEPELGSDYIRQLSSASAVIFPARTVKAAASLSEQSYLMSEALGQALVLASDGWLVTTQAVVSDVSKAYVAMVADGRVYEVKVVVIDPVAPLAYLKIEAHNLTATPFASAEEVTLNEPVVVVTTESQSVSRSWYLRYLANLNGRAIVSGRAELPVSSESIPDRYILSDSLPPLSKGAPVIDLQGKVIGLAADYGGQLRGVVPLVNMSSVMESVFSGYKARRPVLGVTYVQTNWLVTTESLSQSAALLTGTARRAAVVSKSPAATALLNEGDMIVALDGLSLGGQSLSLALQRYRPGSTVEFTIERDGQERKLKVTLGEQAGESSSITAE